MRGKFICFEGADGAGKSTQLKMLSELLKKRDIKHIVTREPGGTLAAEAVRNLIFDSQYKFNSRAELLLFAAARADHVANLIEPALAQGTWVICDRFTLSTIAYQGWGRKLDMKLIEELNAIATNGCTPDMVAILDIEPEAGLARANSRQSGNHFDKLPLDFHSCVNQGFHFLAKQLAYAHIIDARPSVEIVHQAIVKILTKERFICYE